MEWGHNRNKEKLPQINICMLLGEESKLPVYQMVYNGSLNDVSTLKTTLQSASHLNLNNISVVMDKGFCNTKNINTMCSPEMAVRFLLVMPFSHNFAKQQVVSEKKDIDTIDNTITVGDDILRGVTKTRSWKPETKLFTHVFLNVEYAQHVKNKLYGHVSILRDKVMENMKFASDNADCKKYLIIRKNKNAGHTVSIRYDVLENELATAGWLVCISNHVETAKEAIALYRAKDVVEKGFLRLKNCLDLARLRVHSDNAMQNKTFIGFVALIITAHIHKVMTENGLYRNMTMKKLIKSIESLRVQYIKGNRIMFPVSKSQKDIFDIFDLKPIL